MRTVMYSTAAAVALSLALGPTSGAQAQDRGEPVCYKPDAGYPDNFRIVLDVKFHSGLGGFRGGYDQAVYDALGKHVDIARNRTRMAVAHGAVVVSDYLETNPVWHTVNHPDNATLAFMASRVLEALGLPGEPVPPDYEMLGGLDAPVDAAAAEALGVAVHGRDEWRDRVAGVIDADEIAHAQLEFYRQRPALVEHGLQRHAERIANLGLLA